MSLNDRKPDFCLYTPSFSETSKRHLAIGWMISLPEETKFNLDSYEIIQKRGTSKSGSFLSFEEIESKFLTDRNFSMESWSLEILKEYFQDKFSKDFIDYINNTNTQSTFF